MMTMNYLFDDTEKFIKYHRNVSERLEIREVLHPSCQTFIARGDAERLGIISNGHYRNR